MKTKTKITIYFFTFLNLNFANQIIAQSFYENWDSVAYHLPNGWDTINHSTNVGVFPYWGCSGTLATAAPAYNGAFNSNIGAGWSGIYWTGGNENLWLISPLRTFRNGDSIHFFTFSGDSLTYHPDRLQLRLSLNGNSSYVGVTDTGVGDFTNLLLDINPTYSLTGYPMHYVNFQVVISGLSAPTPGRFAFRYYIENARLGNATTISIDSLVYVSSQGSENVGIKELNNKDEPIDIWPNPSRDIFNFHINDVIKSIEIKNMLGQEIIAVRSTEIDLSQYSQGVYIYKLTTQRGKIYVGRLMRE